ncbi:hypothetical protein [Mycetocola reblochoni]|uniref:Uncharacterized protein n=2 Tax=Mycetocola reblochoni TaxID=331618 RepID=A0A1R4KCD5_9MICO|nr:hypothetical protein [Mycetocola reblochoni]RLP69266.1 hypothetical protein D9V30_08115 [Mycetocola reblochoni]SJN41980.1 hypothetical protein FM119_12990 [Mycetocola reblochoni REB411]
MVPAPASAATLVAPSREVLDGLRARIGQMQGTPPPERGFPLSSAFEPLLPGGVLGHGRVYATPHALSLAVGLVAGASAQGAWCAVAGVPDFGVEAALAAGVSGERLVLVPEPGAHALAVVSALVDVVGVVIVGPGLRLSAGELSRLQARLRDRSASLVVVGDWPQPEARLRTQAIRWSGLGRGWGGLGAREVEVVVESRGAGRPRGWLLRVDAEGRAVGSSALRDGAGARTGRIGGERGPVLVPAGASSVSSPPERWAAAR